MMPEEQHQKLTCDTDTQARTYIHMHAHAHTYLHMCAHTYPKTNKQKIPEGHQLAE